MPRSVLVYNVTHSDLILGVKGGDLDPPAFCKPKFSFVEALSSQVLSRFQTQEDIPILQAPLKDKLSTSLVSLGFSFSSFPISTMSSSVHIRGSPESVLGSKNEVLIVSAYIPLAAQLIPNWLNLQTTWPKTIFLVCGAGLPQDHLATPTGNSTRNTAELISLFLKRVLLPCNNAHTEIHVLDSMSNFDLFDYNANVHFMRNELVPRIDSIRRLVAAEEDGKSDWRSRLEVTIALTQGTPARLQSLSASLTPFRPRYAHLRQLKTFWHEKQLIQSDVEFISFEAFETLPAMDVEDIPEDSFRLVVKEMIKYRDDFIQAATAQENELASFWLRKSHRPVLSVLLVKETQGLQFYRGINLEVSQPTGSLCSERNAIGTALTMNPNLNRKDVLLVAVLSLERISISSPEPNGGKRMRSSSSFVEEDQQFVNPLGPCGACTEWLRKISEVNPDFKVMTFTNLKCDKVFIREVS